MPGVKGFSGEWGVWAWLLLGLASLASLIVMLAGLGSPGVVVLLLSLLLLARAGSMALRRRIGVDVLMGVAGLAAWRMGLVAEGLLIMLLYSLAELVEEWAEGYAEARLTGLRSLLPSSVFVEEIGESIGVDMVKPGQVYLLRSGDMVPIDGVVVEGASFFDTSYVTGEPVPRRLDVGDAVLSGYINMGGLVRVRAARRAEESQLQVLLREAERALARKSSIQRRIERLAGPYTLLVLLAFAAVSLLSSPLRGLPILLAGCPSAFILSSSTATTLSVAMLARKSIVARGGLALEKIAGASMVVLDKTGTLSQGELRLSSVAPLNGLGSEELLAYAGGAAKGSSHPASRAIASYSKLAPRRVEEIPGRGVIAVVDGRLVILGSRKLLLDKGINPPPRICGEGLVEVLVAVDGVAAGILCLEEDVGGARRVVEELKELGLKVAIASGDTAERVRRTAGILGVDEYWGDLLPSDKVEVVRRLRETYGRVMYVGDGVNDAGALAEADAGIVVGSLRMVSSVGDAVLPEGIGRLPMLVRDARRYVEALTASLALAAAVKASIMLAGIAGIIPLWAVVAAGDDGATLASLGLIAYLLSRGSQGRFRLRAPRFSP